MRKVTGGGRKILKGVNLTINTGEVHAIMGKNGSGKSTLCQVLAGARIYVVTEGQVMFQWQGSAMSWHRRNGHARGCSLVFEVSR